MNIANYFTSLTPPARYLFIVSSIGTLLGAGLMVVSFASDYFSEMSGLGIVLIVTSLVSIGVSVVGFVHFTRRKIPLRFVFLVFILANLAIFYSVYRTIAS